MILFLDFYDLCCHSMLIFVGGGQGLPSVFGALQQLQEEHKVFIWVDGDVTTIPTGQPLVEAATIPLPDIHSLAWPPAFPNRLGCVVGAH